MSPDPARIGWKGGGIKVIGTERGQHPGGQIRKDLRLNERTHFFFITRQLSQ